MSYNFNYTKTTLKLRQNFILGCRGKLQFALINQGFFQRAWEASPYRSVVIFGFSWYTILVTVLRLREIVKNRTLPKLQPAPKRRCRKCKNTPNLSKCKQQIYLCRCFLFFNPKLIKICFVGILFNYLLLYMVKMNY